LKRALDGIAGGEFSRGSLDLFRPLVDSLLAHDEYMILAETPDYVAMQDTVETAYLDCENWTRKSILNSARSGFFSSDRAVRQYCEEIWKTRPVTPLATADLPQSTENELMGEE
jgi:starch phosphorylase